MTGRGTERAGEAEEGKGNELSDRVAGQSGFWSPRVEAKTAGARTAMLIEAMRRAVKNVRSTSEHASKRSLAAAFVSFRPRFSGPFSRARGTISRLAF